MAAVVVRQAEMIEGQVEPIAVLRQDAPGADGVGDGRLRGGDDSGAGVDGPATPRRRWQTHHTA